MSRALKGEVLKLQAQAELREDVAKMSVPRLAKLISTELEAPPGAKKPTTWCLLATKGQERPRCLPTRAGDFCIRCLSQSLFRNPKSRLLAKEFYNNALSVNLMTSLVKDMTLNPGNYQNRHWDLYALRLAGNVNTIKELKAKQQDQLKSLRRYDAKPPRK